MPIKAAVPPTFRHPELSTNLCDARLQDVVIEMPMVRSLNVPSCDLVARTNSTRLLQTVIEAGSHKSRNEASVAQSQQSQSQPQTSKGATSDPETESSGAAASPSISATSATSATTPNSASSATSATTSNSDSATTTSPFNSATVYEAATSYWTAHRADPAAPATFLQLRRSYETLLDLVHRPQGAVCFVFWELWDGIAMKLIDIVGVSALVAATAGRLFRPAGDSAVYITAYEREELRSRRREGVEVAQQTDLEISECVKPQTAPQTAPQSSAITGSLATLTEYNPYTTNRSAKPPSAPEDPLTIIRRNNRQQESLVLTNYFYPDRNLAANHIMNPVRRQGSTGSTKSSPGWLPDEPPEVSASDLPSYLGLEPRTDFTEFAEFPGLPQFSGELKRSAEMSGAAKGGAAEPRKRIDIRQSIRALEE